MSDLSEELAKLIARASSTGSAAPEVVANDAVTMVQALLPAGVGAPAFEEGMLQRAGEGRTVLQPHVMALQAAYEVIGSLLQKDVKQRSVIDAAREFDMCLAGELPASVFSEKQMKLHEALEALEA